MSVWWIPAPRDGEIVPDYPPIELTGDVTVTMLTDYEPALVPPWADGIARGDPCPGITFGDWPEDPDEAST